MSTAAVHMHRWFVRLVPALLGLAVSLPPAGRLRAQPQVSPRTHYVAATVDGSTYRGTDYQRQGDGIVIVTARGASIVIPGPKLAQVWPDDETEDMPRDAIVRTDCPQGRTKQPRVRELVLGEEAPFRAELLEVRPGRAVRFRRLGHAAPEERPWADVVAIQRLEDAPDVCALAQPAAQPTPSAAASAPPAGKAAEPRCDTRKVVWRYLGRSFQLQPQPGCPPARGTVEVRQGDSSRTRGWATLLPGRDGLALLLRGQAEPEDTVLLNPASPPVSILDAGPLPDRSLSVSRTDYLLQADAIDQALRVEPSRQDPPGVEALRQPKGQPVRLDLLEVHRFLQPSHFNQPGPVRVQIASTHRLRLPAAVLLPVGVALTVLGASVLRAADTGGWLSSDRSCGGVLAGLCVIEPLVIGLGGAAAVLGGSAVLAGVVLLSVDAAHRYPAERRAR